MLSHCIFISGSPFYIVTIVYRCTVYILWCRVVFDCIEWNRYLCQHEA